MLDIRYEIGRKIIHFGYLIFPILYLFGFSKDLVLSVLTACLTAMLVMEMLRIDFYMDFPLFALLRDRERHLSGATFIFLGQIIAISAFSKPVAIASICMALFGDAASALVGKTLGSRRIWGPRNLEGILAEFVVDLVVGFIIFANFQLPWIPIIFGAIVATLTETVSYRVDDNLIIPLFSGLAISIFLV